MLGLGHHNAYSQLVSDIFLMVARHRLENITADFCLLIFCPVSVSRVSRIDVSKHYCLFLLSLNQNEKVICKPKEINLVEKILDATVVPHHHADMV